MDTTARKFQKLPKVELHAHLNGSISNATFRNVDILMARGHRDVSWTQSYQEVVQLMGKPRNYAECFQLFRAIHDVIDNTETVQKMTCEIIKEFNEDGVSYLELRTTPRKFPTSSTEDYVEAVVSAIQTCKNENCPIIVRLLVSIDRSQGLQVAHETLALTRKLSNKYPDIIVGMDFSGNPRSGDGSHYASVLREAKSLGLKISLHVAELLENLEESLNLLTVLPDRVGHGTFIHPQMGGSRDLMALITKNSIPLEICPTSNVMLQAVPSYESHHFQYWHRENHPCIICTDDKGVFDTTLSEEYGHLQRAFNMTDGDMWKLAYRAIDHIFGGEAVKNYLKGNFKTVTGMFDSK